MPLFNTPARKAQKANVTPSSRDSISGWLDVLSSMLSLPESQRLQVRDELEDHLRSRVDDLLITGTPEPEAIRKAVAELGETAELAKLISHAHTRANPRRRIMNIALITAAVAGLSIGGISWNGGSWTSGTLAAGSGGALVMPDDTEPGDGRVHAFEFENASIHTMLSEITAAFDRKVVFSRGAMNQGYLGDHLASMSGSFTFTQAMERFQSLYNEGVYDYKIEITDESVIYQTYDEYQRNRIELRVYPVPSWIMNSSGQYEYAESIQSLLEVKYDLEFTSIRAIGDSVVVAAPPEIQVEVVKLSEELDAIVTRRNAEVEATQLKAEYERAIELQQSVERIQSEFAHARETLKVNKMKYELIEAELKSKSNAFNPDHVSSEVTAQQIQNLKSMMREIELVIDESEERYMYLRSRLLDSKYAALFAGLE